MWSISDHIILFYDHTCKSYDHIVNCNDHILPSRQKNPLRFEIEKRALTKLKQSDETER